MNNSPFTTIAQNNQMMPVQKIRKLNYNNQYDLNSIKKAKIYDNKNNYPKIFSQQNYNNMNKGINNTIFNNNFNYNNNINHSLNNFVNSGVNNIPYIVSTYNNITKPQNESILNLEHLNKIQNANKLNKFSQNQYQVSSINSNSSFSSHNSNLSITSQKKRFDKFGNPIYSVSINTPKKNQKTYQNNQILRTPTLTKSILNNNNLNYSPYSNKRSLSHDEFIIESKRTNRFFDQNIGGISPYESPIGTPRSNKKINYNVNSIGSINNNNNLKYINPNLCIIKPNDIEIDQENKKIIEYYLNLNCRQLETFNPESFKFFYPYNEKDFKIPQNEIIAKQEITNYTNNNPYLFEKYTGTVNKFGHRHGLGKLITPNSHKIGNWKYGQFSGWGREIFMNGEVYEGNYKDGKLNGKGIYKYKNILYVGDFDNNIRQGKGELITKDYYYKGEFNNNKINGYGKINFIYSADGKSEYEGFFKEGIIEGKGIIKWNNGNVYDGEVKKGKMNGFGTFIPKNGIPIKGFFENGVRVDINNNINNNIKINTDNIRF